MKVKKIEYLIDKGNLQQNESIQLVIDQVLSSIKSVVWPEGSNIFTVFPVKQANGVKPIKEACMLSLEDYGWTLEKPMEIGSRLRPGPIDAVYQVPNLGSFAVEWETGNVSSSHRALNKIALGLKYGMLIAGFLIVPSRSLYKYLTDRIGNFQELEPYFPIWRDIKVEKGLFGVIEIEHEKESMDVPTIKKGTDGRALK